MYFPACQNCLILSELGAILDLPFSNEVPLIKLSIGFFFSNSKMKKKINFNLQESNTPLTVVRLDSNLAQTMLGIKSQYRTL